MAAVNKEKTKREYRADRLSSDFFRSLRRTIYLLLNQVVPSRVSPQISKPALLTVT